MNLVILEEKDFIGENIVEIKGRRFEHIFNIHKAELGKNLNVGVLNGKIGEGKIIRMDCESLQMEINLFKNPPKPSNIKIIMAMSRPKMFKRIIKDLTSLGVKEIYVIKTWKVEKSFWNSPVIEEEIIRECAILGLEQGKDTIMPKIKIFKRFKPFIEDEIIGIIKDTKALIAHPFSDNENLEFLKNKKLTLAIGPEGGFTDYEVRMFKKYGFKDFKLGERILRVETVLPYIIGKLS